MASLYPLVALQFPETIERYWRISWIIGGGLAFAIVLVFRRALRQEWLSPSVSYMVIFWLFHFGLVFPAAISPNLLISLPSWYVGYFTKPETSTAVLAALLFMAAFAWGASCWPSRPQKMTVASGTKTKGLIIVGVIFVLLGVAQLVVFLANQGVQAFFQSYIEFFSISSVPLTSILLVTYGLILITVGGIPFRALFLIGGLTYLPIFALLMLSGSRTGPLFTAVALLIIVNMRGIRIPRAWLVVAAIVILMIIATINEYRLTGLSNTMGYKDRLTLRNPVKGMVELGGSICPVVATIEYMDSNPFLYGQTYVYPFYRQAARVLGRDPGSPDADIRFIARHITSIYGAFGYSTVAEAYANGGILAISIFAGAWGIALRLLHRIKSTPYGAAILAVVLIPMLINIRNSFIYVPAWILVGLLPLGVVWLFSRRKSFKNNSIRHMNKSL